MKALKKYSVQNVGCNIGIPGHYPSFFIPSVYGMELKFCYHVVGTVKTIRAKFCAICTLSCEIIFARRGNETAILSAKRRMF